MANNFKRRSLKGVVLIMVVTVMLMLIILLLATMAVVSTAQNRYYTKFEENQAYYTARSALDVYVDNIFADKQYYADDGTGNPRKFKYSGGDPAGNKIKQGLAMQLDTYRIMAYADTIENYNQLSEAEKAGEPKDLPTAKKPSYWANSTNDIFTSANGCTTMDEQNCYSAPDLPYIDYQIEFPEITNGSNSYGGIVDKDPSDTTKQIATIRIQVLARTYNGHTASASEADDKKAIAKSDRFKDTVYLKATSIVEFQGVEGTASVVFSAPESENQFTSAITATGAITNADNALIIEGFAAPGMTAFPNEGVFVGKSYTGADVGGSGGSITFSMSKKECSYFKGITNVPNNFYPTSLGGFTDAKDAPTIFVDGDCTFGNNVSWGGGQSGTVDKQVDLVVNGDFAHTNNTFDVNGNIIVKGDLTLSGTNYSLAPGCYIIVGGDLKVNREQARNALKSSNFNVYVGGNVEINDTNNIQLSDAFTGLHITSASKITIGSFVYEYNGAGAKFIASSGMWQLNDSLVDTQKVGMLGSFDMDFGDDFDASATNGAENTTDGLKIYLPTYESSGDRVKRNHGDPDYERLAPNVNSKYSQYWKVDSTGTPVGDLDGDGFNDYVSAEEMAGTTKKADRDVGNYTALDFETVPAGATTISSGGTYDVTGQTDFYLKTCDNAKIYFNGTGTANIFVEKNSSMRNDCLIQAEDTVRMNFYFPKGNYSWKCPVVNTTVYNSYVNNHILCFGSEGTGATACIAAPKIKYYMSKDSVFNAEMGSCMLTGYVYAPEATVNLLGGWNKGSCDYYYNNQKVKKGNGSDANDKIPAIVGAIVCQHYTTQNQPAICYVKDETTPEHGEPLWDSGDTYYYARS